MSGINYDFSRPIYEPHRRLRVVCAGAGASGLLVAYKLQRHFDDFELQIFEKNEDIGGTWLENIYPGQVLDKAKQVIIDEPRLMIGLKLCLYTWSFEPKTNWSATYASSQEIFEYFKDFETKYGLGKYIKFKSRVTNAVWDDRFKQWRIQVQDLASGSSSVCFAHVFINATGILNAWRYPPIPGIDKFRGELVHSAAWKSDLRLEGKVVGLIGNGSSGVQILPAIKDKCKEVITIIREPVWISSPFGEEYRTYTDEDKARFAEDPEYHLQFRRETEANMNSGWGKFMAGSRAQKTARAHMVNEMERRLGDDSLLRKLLIPEWSVGCRRLTPGTGYLESFKALNVKAVYGEILNIEETACVMEDNRRYPIDVLICATGFDTTFKPRFPILGSSGKDLAVAWSESPEAYFGIAVSHYPNYFMILGPNCPIGNGPVLPAIEAEVEYIVKMLSKFQKENISSFDIKPGPVADFNAWTDNFMSKTVWTENCRSWYKSGSKTGRVTALWPGSTLHYLEAMESPRWEDWDFAYKPNTNRFQYLGNGSSSAESSGSKAELSHYIKNEDDSRVENILKKQKGARAREASQVPAPKL